MQKQINIQVFGQLCEVIGEQLTLENIPDTDTLTKTLNEKYPTLLAIKYLLAVDKKLVIENVSLTNDSSIALMPAFSGG